MTAYLQRHVHPVGPKRVRRLLRKMGLEALYQKPNTSQASLGHSVLPYLLRVITAAYWDYVWSTDIPYVRFENGFVYLMAVMGLAFSTVLEALVDSNKKVVLNAASVDAVKKALNHL